MGEVLMRKFDLESPYESWQFLRFVGWLLLVISVFMLLLLLAGYQSELGQTVREWEYCLSRWGFGRCGPLQDQIDWFNNRFALQFFGAAVTLPPSVLMIILANRRKQRNIARHDHHQSRMNHGE